MNWKKFAAGSLDAPDTVATRKRTSSLWYSLVKVQKKNYVITRHNLDGKFHLYEEKDDAYIHLRQRSSDPFFKETSPEHYAKGDIEYTR
ncbi:MAG: hypothetical protein IJ168_01965 [Eubacterium sp.]|nr:hypothetical protein [Eubacterium sp.]